MVQSCCAVNCHERAKNGTTYAFHRFPLQNKDLMKLWCLSLRRKDFHPTEHTRICSKHFTKDSYKRGFKNRKLKLNAVPTIFDFDNDESFRRKLHLYKPYDDAANDSFSSDFEDENHQEIESNISDDGSQQNKSSVEIIKLTRNDSFFSEDSCTDDKDIRFNDKDPTESQNSQTENEKLRQVVCHLNSKIESLCSLIDCLEINQTISEEAAIVLRSTMEI